MARCAPCNARSVGDPSLDGCGARTDRDTPRQDPCINLIITETEMLLLKSRLFLFYKKSPLVFYKKLFHHKKLLRKNLLIKFFTKNDKFLYDGV
jgi:hypothetical protein